MFKQYFDSKESENPVFWEEVPDEDLWEDGELNQRQVQSKIYNNINKGIYQLIRRKND
jgi:hypothetical protein